MLHSGSRGVGNEWAATSSNRAQGHGADVHSICRTGIWLFPRTGPSISRITLKRSVGTGFRSLESPADDGAVVDAVRKSERFVLSRPSSRRSTATTTMWPANSTMAKTFWSLARARCAPAKAIWESFPAAWERVPTSFAARATRRAFKLQPRRGPCDVSLAKRSAVSRLQITIA